MPFSVLRIVALIAGLTFVSVTAELDAQCTLTCSATVPASASAGSDVLFAATASPCNCAAVPTYSWTFGDGGSSSEQDPVHSYANPGTYNWQLTTDADGTVCTKSGSIQATSGGSVVPTAGTYVGTLDSGGAFSLTVNASAQVTNWSIAYTCPYSAGTISSSSACSIVNGSFTCGVFSCAPYATLSGVSGTFTSPTTVSGTASVRSQPTPFVSCCIRTPTYTATLSPAPLTASAGADVTSGPSPLTVNFTGGASGGTPPYTFAWNFGDCSPEDAQQNPQHAFAAGIYYAVLTVTDSASGSATAPIRINSIPPFSISTSSPLPDGNEGVPYSQTLAVSGGSAPYAWTVASGSLPPDLSLSTDGTISGTPSTGGIYGFNVGVQENGGLTANKDFSLTIHSPPPTVSSVAPAVGSIVGGLEVTVSGSNFRSGMTASFGATAGNNPTVVSPSSLTVETPAASAGTVDVVVRNPDAQTATLPAGFTYVHFDANADGGVTVADLLAVIDQIFASGTAPGLADATNDGNVDVNDVFYLVNYFFASGPAPY